MIFKRNEGKDVLIERFLAALEACTLVDQSCVKEPDWCKRPRSMQGDPFLGSIALLYKYFLLLKNHMHMPNVF